MLEKRPSVLLVASAVAAALAVAAGVLAYRGLRPTAPELRLVPRPEAAGPPPVSSTAAVGWSRQRDGSAAAREALRGALDGLGQEKPHALLLFATDPSPLGAAVAELRRRLGASVPIFGGASDTKGLFTPGGLLTQAPGEPPALAVLAIASREIAIGVGAAAFGESWSFAEAARAAATRALESAARPREQPRALLLAATGENVRQDEVLDGIGQIFGRDTPVLGARVAAAILADGAAGEGIAIAALYTSLPFGWTFEGGYDVSSEHSGVITRMEGEQRLLEIDGRPALDVYDEWLGGGLRRLYREHPPEVANDMLALDPLYVRHRSARGEVYSVFSHVWPTDETLQIHSLEVGTAMQVGERLHLANGSWETLLNRVANLPRSARRRGGVEGLRPILGFGYVCSGVMGVIPARERPKAPLLMSQHQSGAPFLAVVSWGEHGYLPGVGNRFGNLLSSYLVIGASPEAAEGPPPPRAQ